MAAVAELIWNALDAEATEVRVEFVENELGGIDTVRVRDNGHGLDYDHALVVFENLGGSWKRETIHTAARQRMLHGKFGKGRFRAFAAGNRVAWTTHFTRAGQRLRYTITGRAAAPGEFELTDPEPAGDGPRGMVVEIADLPGNIELLRGVKATQEATDLFALYLRQYPDAAIIYDGVPLDPANAEDSSISYDLGEHVTENGERLRLFLTIVEWNIPGKRGIILCNEEGFALHVMRPRLYFRGFSYTAYLKSAYFAELDREGVLQLDEMAPEVKSIVALARTRLRQHFALREAERARDVLAQWRETGLYPYEGAPANQDEECERRIFDIYAAHLNHVEAFANARHGNKRFMLRLLQELVRAEPARVIRILDEWLTLPDDKEEALSELLDA